MRQKAAKLLKWKTRISVMCVIFVLAALSVVLFPMSVDAAGETTLDIALGSITISETGANGGGVSESTLNPAGYIIVMSSGTSTTNTITVTASTTITLSGVNIDVSGTETACAFSIDSGATINLILENTNTLNSGKDKAGLQVPSGTAIVISGTGSLDATGGESAAGIGGGYNGDGGNITISGGIVTAKGVCGAGIGGGYYGDGGIITIEGNAEVIATSGNYFCGAGIGGGCQGNGGTIVIEGNAEVTAIGLSGAAGIGGGEPLFGNGGSSGRITINGGNVTATGGYYSAGIGSGGIGDYDFKGGDGGIITISGGTITATGGEAGGAGIGGSAYRNGGTVNIEGGTVTATGGYWGAGIGSGDYGDIGSITISGGMVTATSSYGGDHWGGAAGIGSGRYGEIGSIAISGGTVVATGEDDGAGIGGGYLSRDIGEINISGGDVTAKGDVGGTGIGGGYHGAGGNITISSGTVTAQGGQSAAGIGGGNEGIGGTIKISNAEVVATGGQYGAGIGGGLNGDGGIITIEGNVEVTAKGGSGLSSGSGGGAGIGGGSWGTGGNIVISGGNVNATGGNYSAGIGGGCKRNGGKIIIEGSAKVTATGGNYGTSGPSSTLGKGGGAGIGGGYNSAGGDITLSGGTVLALGGYYGAGIGGGYIGAGGSITIDGGVIYAEKGGDATFDIGDGVDGSGGTISITNDAAVFLKSGSCITPTTTHTFMTFGIVTEHKVYGIDIPGTWDTPVYAYLNEDDLFELSYDANGGTGTVPEAVTQYIGTTVSIADGSGFEKDGNSFVCWYTKINGRCIKYYYGDIFEFSANIVLYATYEDIINVDYLSINSDAEMLVVGDTLVLNATVLPSDATYPEVIWTSSNTTVAMVDQNGNVTATASGSATITATADGVSGTCEITVEKIPVSSISLSSNAENIIAGNSTTLSATVTPSAATYPEVTWTSSNTGIATVDQTGKVSAIANGSTTITATADGVSDTCEVTVIQPVSSVSLNSKSETLIAGDTLTLTATVSPTDATYPAVTWTSSNPDIATVDQTGKVTAIALGSATITATADGVSDTCKVTVKPAAFNIAAASGNISFGYVTGGDTYVNGASVTLTATPNAGYRFVRWLNGSTQVSTSATYTLIANADLSFTAEFAPIGTPTVSAASSGYDRTQLSWSDVEGAAGYEVWRSTSSGGTYTKIGTSSGTSYTDTGLATNTTYYYKVKAYCSASTVTTFGNLSAYASVVPIPTAPDAAYATVASYSSVRLNWNAVPGASGYSVYRATSPGGVYSLIKTTTSLSYTNRSLKTGTSYYYKVRAYRKVGRTKVYSGDSSVVSATPALSPVANAKATVTYPTKVKVSWSAVSGRTRYEVWRSENGGAYTLIGTTTKTYYTSTNLTPFKTYSYYIRVYRTVSGQKIYATVNSPTASATPTLANVANVRAKSSVTSVKLTWSRVTGASGYEVLRWDAANGRYTVIASTTKKYYTNKNLIPNQSYSYEVRAYCTVAGIRTYSAACSPVSATPVFGSVMNPKAVRSNATRIKLTWKAVSGRSGYEIYRATAIDGEYVLIGSTTKTSFNSSGLTTGTPYYYMIRAYVTVNGVRQYSGYSAVVTATP